MERLLAVDPGLRYPAAALFVGGVLVCASRVKVKLDTKAPMVERCRDIALAVEAWHRKQSVHDPEILVVEFPQIYTADKSKGDPNNLTPLACIDGALAALFKRSKVLSPKPKDWTGNLPKSEDGDPWKSPRGLRVWGRLTPDERKVVVPSHDAIDSVGLGLWALGRFERRRVYDMA